MISLYFSLETELNLVKYFINVFRLNPNCLKKDVIGRHAEKENDINIHVDKHIQREAYQ